MATLTRWARTTTRFLLPAVLLTGVTDLAAQRLPGEHWMRYTNVEEAGFDAAKLDAARQTWQGLPSSAFMVVVDGAVVADWGDLGRRFMCHSVRKSFMSGLYGIYWDRGEIELNKTMADEGIDDYPDPLLDTERQARILDLLKARSGVFHPAAYAGRTDSRPRGSEGPGRYFAYNNWDFNTLATILMQEEGIDIFEAFDEFFGQPLGMEDWRVSDGYYHYERDKSRYPAYPFRMSARDAARFGLLYARSGVWGDTRILSDQWVQRSSAMYSIDTDIMGYGFLWWIYREPRFAQYHMYSALGVGNQMIAVLPDLDMVIVNRANTYEGESTPLRPLLDLIEQVLHARTGAPVDNPSLTPLTVRSDPLVTSVDDDALAAFAGTWDLPAPPLGLPAQTATKVEVEDGHLVVSIPVAGTFQLYLQPDGTFHMEDSHDRYWPIRDDAGTFAGLADATALVRGALLAAADGQQGRAQSLLAMTEGEAGLLEEVAAPLIDLLSGERGSAERAIQSLADQYGDRGVDRAVNSIGRGFLGMGRAEAALTLFQLDTRLFPNAFNPWNSLGDAHMALGNQAEAIRAFQHVLELNAGNEHAQAMIEQLRGEGR
jgi:CubicO group peptidase (beta-lactamase class C family)